MNYVIRLTPAQHSALMSILVDQTRRDDATQRWIDVVNNVTTTLDDLLTLIGTAKGEME